MTFTSYPAPAGLLLISIFFLGCSEVHLNRDGGQGIESSGVSGGGGENNGASGENDDPPEPVEIDPPHLPCELIPITSPFEELCESNSVIGGYVEHEYLTDNVSNFGGYDGIYVGDSLDIGLSFLPETFVPTSSLVYYNFDFFELPEECTEPFKVVDGVVCATYFNIVYSIPALDFYVFNADPGVPTYLRFFFMSINTDTNTGINTFVVSPEIYELLIFD